METQNVNNYEELNLMDFDLLGAIRLTDVEGIERLVTPVGDGTYISRGVEFCREMTCAQASNMREYLKRLLQKYPRGKKAFTIADHMANLSGKVYYEEVQRAINQKNYDGIGAAKRALKEDVANIIRIIEGQPIVSSETVLPQSQEFLAKRIIECNNMALLYVFTKCFSVPKGYNILNTGLGGIFIGPFFNYIHGTRWTNLLKSKYVDEVNKSERYDIARNTVNFNLFRKDKKILLLDDNIGTGATASEIEEELIIKGFQVMTGAVQYNWINFYKVGAGEKDIQRFKPSKIDYVTQFNYPGHKLIDHAFKMLTGKRDLCRNEPSLDDSTPWGAIYLAYLTSKGYGKSFLSDIFTLQTRGIKSCNESGIPLELPEIARMYRDVTGEDLVPAKDEPEEDAELGPIQVFTETSKNLMSSIDAANVQLCAQLFGEPISIGPIKPEGDGYGGGFKP